MSEVIIDGRAYAPYSLYEELAEERDRILKCSQGYARERDDYILKQQVWEAANVALRAEHIKLNRANTALVAQICAQDARVVNLEAALRGLYDDNVLYLRLNNLGGFDNHLLTAARAALGITVENEGK
jgi:hypothetical protein